MSAAADHQHEARYIYHLKGQIGHELATCRHCDFVATTTLQLGVNHTSIEFQGWRESTEEERKALPTFPL